MSKCMLFFIDVQSKYIDVLITFCRNIINDHMLIEPKCNTTNRWTRQTHKYSSFEVFKNDYCTPVPSKYVRFRKVLDKNKHQAA